MPAGVRTKGQSSVARPRTTARVQSGGAWSSSALRWRCALLPLVVLGPCSAAARASSVPSAQQLPAPPARAQTTPLSAPAISALANGDFSRSVPVQDFSGPRIPWWRIRAGQPRVLPGGEGQPAALELPQGSALEQPLAGLPGALVGLRISGSLMGGARLRLLSDGAPSSDQGYTIAAGQGQAWTKFDWTWPAELAPLAPRLCLVLDAPEAAGQVRALHVSVPLPLKTEAELATFAGQALEALIAPWLAGALDRAGPRPSAFVVGSIDAETGKLLGPVGRRVSMHPLYAQLLRAQALAPRPAWEAALLAFLEDYLDLGLHPETGLPQVYDPVEDQPLPDVAVEIAAHAEFLLDWVEFGPPAGRERAASALRRMLATALERGVLPDGSVAAKYVPRTATPDTGTVELRRLDVPARWVRAYGPQGVLRRMGSLSPEELARGEAMLQAARDAVWQLELYHYWPGTAERIDPGFDDEYGHYGARAIEMWAAAPEDEAFRELALSGLERYGPLWDAALAYGGNIAADQVRCWQIAAKAALLEPSRASAIQSRLLAAAQVHFTGQQNSAGSWIDTTVVGFDPQNLPVGDTLGVPQNLLVGLAVVAGAVSGPERELTLGRFLAVWQQSEQVFRRPYGLVDGPGGSRGAAQAATGSLRVIPGLIALLRALEPAGDPR